MRNRNQHFEVCGIDYILIYVLTESYLRCFRMVWDLGMSIKYRKFFFHRSALMDNRE